MYPAALALVLAASLPGQPVPAARPAGSISEDEKAVRAASLDPGPVGLLAFFRGRVPHPVGRTQIENLVGQLAAKDAAVAARAAGELVALGHAAADALHAAALQPDDEAAAARARKCLDAIEGPGASALTEAAARVLGARRPDGAVATLLDYLPFADNDAVFDEVQAALRRCARHGKADAALLAALKDPVPVRRSTAAAVLCLEGGSAGRDAVRPLLADPRQTVRLRAALALLDGHEAAGVPVLIDLLAELPPEGRKQAETRLGELAGEWAVSGPAGDDAISARVRREAWRAWWSQVDGRSLLEEFRTRTLTDAEREQAVDWVRRLGDAPDDGRSRAAAALQALGSRAAPLLRHAASAGGPAADEARKCLQALDADGARPLPAAATRLLALRRPAGATEALLAYLPDADEDTAGDLIGLLAVVACRDGRPEPALLKALDDRVSSRRVAAAAALCRAADDSHLPDVRRLLRDPDPEVRLGGALALAGRGERDALGVLVSLLGELPPTCVWRAESCLSRLAGDDAPAVVIPDALADRGPAVEAWRKWWRDRGAAVDMARAEPDADRGTLFVLENQGARGAGRLLEVGPSGRVLWEMTGLNFLMDAQPLPGGNVLVLEQNSQLSERTRAGKVLWKKFVPGVFACRTLPGGCALAVGRQQLWVFDRHGNEVATHRHPLGFILAAEGFRDGQIGFVTFQGNYVRLDAAGREVKTFAVGFPMHLGVSTAAVLPGDRVLIAQPNPGRVCEYGPNGKPAWEAAVAAPGALTRLPDGHTLVLSNNHALIELDRTGRVVREKKDLSYQPFRIYSR
jgi:HEAT repeat protein